VIECYDGSRPQAERSTNEDAFVIGRDPVPYAAVCDGAGNAQQAAHHVVRFFERMIKDPQAQVADPATWTNWVRLMDSQLLGGTQSTFVGVAVPDEKARLVVGAYAGNSRAYAEGENGVRLLTAESSLARLGSGRVKPCPIMLRLGPTIFSFL
jgi:serine/threonine protein phosphatase PrpC